jgi:uncharacterized protein (TIGR02145 family)
MNQTIMKTKNRIWFYSFITVGLVFILTNSCKKDDNDNPIPTATCKDIDGNEYSTVTIGTQVWMRENLKVTKYRNGDAIPNVTDMTEWKNLTTGAYCNYDNNPANADIYGTYYNWYAVIDSRNIAPTGWHVPTDAEWKTLADYLLNNGYGYEGSGGDVGKSMASNSGWNTDPTPGTVGNDQASNNSSNFSALPGGERGLDGDFADMGKVGMWWSATEKDATEAWLYLLVSDNKFLNPDFYQKVYGISIRCVKD